MGCNLEHAVSCPAREDGLLSCLRVPFGPSLSSSVGLFYLTTIQT
jgi:hypothetical protein